MTTRCLYCSKAFGLVRRGVDFGIGRLKVRVLDNRFCDYLCEGAYRKSQQQEVRVLQFLQWLHARPP